MIYDDTLLAAEGDTLLNRKDAADMLTRMGFKISPATLATKASRGGGPPYRLFGVRPLYRRGDALTWAQERLSALRCSTSEKDAVESKAPAQSIPKSSSIVLAVTK